MGPNPTDFIRRSNYNTNTQRGDWVRTQEKMLSTRQEERSHRNQPCQHLDLRLQHWEKLNFCSSSYLVCGTLLWHLEHINVCANLDSSVKKLNVTTRSTSCKLVQGLPFFLAALRGILEKQWHPTPVFLPGKSYGWWSLVGCSPWGH